MRGPYGRAALVAVLLAGCTSPNPDYTGRGDTRPSGDTLPGDDYDGPACIPECQGRECGPDGCGGSCGTCPAPLSCNEHGRCVQGCKPDCQGKQCGPDGCGGTCGHCNPPLVCDESAGICVSCIPACSDRECGPDGCGGSCGTCPFPAVCDEASGKCVAEGSCGPVTYEGCCDGQTLYYCDNGKLRTQDCSSQPKCGWDFQNKFYNCGTAGLPDPTGQYPKQCP